MVISQQTASRTATVGAACALCWGAGLTGVAHAETKPAPAPKPPSAADMQHEIQAMVKTTQGLQTSTNASATAAASSAQAAQSAAAPLGALISSIDAKATDVSSLAASTVSCHSVKIALSALHDLTSSADAAGANAQSSAVGASRAADTAAATADDIATRLVALQADVKTASHANQASAALFHAKQQFASVQADASAADNGASTASSAVSRINAAAATVTDASNRIDTASAAVTSAANSQACQTPRVSTTHGKAIGRHRSGAASGAAHVDGSSRRTHHGAGVATAAGHTQRAATKHSAHRARHAKSSHVLALKVTNPAPSHDSQSTLPPATFVATPTQPLGDYVPSHKGRNVALTLLAIILGLESVLVLRKAQERLGINRRRYSH